MRKQSASIAWSLVDSLVSVFHTSPRNLSFDIFPSLKSRNSCYGYRIDFHKKLMEFLAKGRTIALPLNISVVT